MIVKKKDQKHKRNITIPLEMKISIDSFIKFRLRNALYSYNFFFFNIYATMDIYKIQKERKRDDTDLYLNISNTRRTDFRLFFFINIEYIF